MLRCFRCHLPCIALVLVLVTRAVCTHQRVCASWYVHIALGLFLVKKIFPSTAVRTCVQEGRIASGYGPCSISVSARLRSCVVVCSCPHACSPCMQSMLACSLCMRSMFACSLCMRSMLACSLCMLTMRACCPCVHAVHARMQSVHVVHACCPCVHAVHARMHAETRLFHVLLCVPFF